MRSPDRREYSDDPRWQALLEPLREGGPCGADIRGGAAYADIREAMREDDEGDMGIWQRTRKVADWTLVSRLSTTELTHTSKDLQLAAWWVLAELRLRGFAGFAMGLRLVEELIDRFWEGLYPPIEDGDTALRTVPLEWLASRLGHHLRLTPITRAGHTFYRFQGSTSVPTEDDAALDDKKRRQREEAVADGKATPEEILEALRATPDSLWQQALSDLDEAADTLGRIEAACGRLCHDEPPTFGGLHDTIQELAHTLRALPARKQSASAPAPHPQPTRALEPADDPFAAFEEAPASEPEETTDDDPFAAFPQPNGTPLEDSRPTRHISPTGTVGLSTALAQHAAALRDSDPADPSPYLLVRGLRFNELRAALPELKPALLEAPTLALRRSLRALDEAGEWRELLEAAEHASAEPCGRAWLDLHAYSLKAALALGFTAVHTAVSTELARLLADIPALPDATLDDETPCASAATRTLLSSLTPHPPIPTRHTPHAYPPPPDSPAALARMLQRQTHPRARFHYRALLAQAFLVEARPAAALPILRDLLQEIDDRRLADWEKPDDLALPVRLYCQALRHTGEDPGEMTLQLLARLDPLAAAEAS